MATFDPQSLTQTSLAEAIKTCKKFEAKYKDKEIKKKKYGDIRKTLEKSEETLNKAVEATKNIKMQSGKSFFEEFVEGKEAAVSLAWLGAKLGVEKDRITEGKLPNLGSDVSVEFKYDFVDKTKQTWFNLTHGKGIAKGLTTAAGGILIGELLTQGVTAYLTKKGIMDGAMGLLGLGKLGIEFAPTAWQAIVGAAGALTSWSMVACVAAGALVAVKAIPMVRNLVEKAKAKHKEAGAFDENMQKLIAGQKVMEERS